MSVRTNGQRTRPEQIGSSNRIVGSLAGARLTVSVLLATALLAGCTAQGADAGGLASQSTDGQSAADSAAVASPSSFFTTDRVHQISVDMNEADYQAMLDAYAATGDKEWIAVDVTIDGVTYRDAGLRLKGNSTLRSALAGARGLKLTEADLEGDDEDAAEPNPGDGPGEEPANSPNADNPATMPWLIRLDKYVDGQEHLGRHDYVVRANATESYLNEALAVAMLEEAGLPTHRVAFTAFSVNGGAQVLRLVSEVQDDDLWNEEWFDGGSTWKADSSGDWAYHGDDGASYEDIWKQRTGEEDMTPIVEFMDFINNASDEEFEQSLGDKLEIEQFATYLAFEDMIGNWDTISGPGNNGYLHFDPTTGRMTVVAWDHDRAFESMSGAGMPGGNQDGAGFGPGGVPEGMEMPEGGFGPGGSFGADGEDGFQMPDGEQADCGGSGGRPGQAMGMGSNILETRFRATEQFAALVDQQTARLQSELIDSGFALATLNSYSDLLSTQASQLIAPTTSHPTAAGSRHSCHWSRPLD